jgi:hypothetical protein
VNHVQDRTNRAIRSGAIPISHRVDKLDPQMFRKLLKLVIDWDTSKGRGGQLSVFNNLVITVPGHEHHRRVIVCMLGVIGWWGKLREATSSFDSFCSQVIIRAHPCESNLWHGRVRTDWVMFIPPWCPRPPSQLQLWKPEDFAHVSFGKVRVGAVS